jgi:hypothetical protein
LSRDYDVVVFWDSLEHHADLAFMHDLSCSLIAVSVPWCHEFGTPWFDRWKHRKPDEHLHHFSPAALRTFMQATGWRMIAWNNHEDTIRIPVDARENILSSAFVRASRAGFSSDLIRCLP